METISDPAKTIEPALPSRDDASPRPRSDRTNWKATASLFVAAVFWFSPLLLLVATALRSAKDFAARGALALPHELSLHNFSRAWDTGGFIHTYTNSALITVVKVPLGVLIAAMLGYALSQLNLPLRGPVMYAIFLGLTIPVYIMIVPLFTMLRGAGLTDSIWGLLGPYLAFGLPFETLVLASFIKRIPHELLEAARVDGAGALRIFVQIILPLSVPALITVAVLDGVATWNEFLMALIILNSPEHQTIPVGLLQFQGQFANDFTGLTAGILIAVLPILVAYAFLQRFIVGGLTTGALKG